MRMSRLENICEIQKMILARMWRWELTNKFYVGDTWQTYTHSLSHSIMKTIAPSHALSSAGPPRFHPLSISLPHLVKKIKNHWHIYLHAWTNINFHLSQCDKIWWHLKSLWQNCEALFSWCQSLEPALAKCQWFWANLHCCKWPNFEKIAYPSAHTEDIFLHHQPMSWKQSHSHIFISLSTSL